MKEHRKNQSVALGATGHSNKIGAHGWNSAFK